jgi:hypothetical protein
MIRSSSLTLIVTCDSRRIGMENSAERMFGAVELPAAGLRLLPEPG